MPEIFSNFFSREITPDNDWTGNYQLITKANYSDDKSYLIITTSDDTWTKEEAKKFVEYCESIDRKSLIAEIHQSGYKAQF